MHRIKVDIAGRFGLMAALAVLVALVAVLPMFGRPAYADSSKDPQHNTVLTSRFIIPGGPSTRVAEPFGSALQCSEASQCTLEVRSTAGFPASGQIVVSDGGPDDKEQTEIMTYKSIEGLIEAKGSASYHVTGIPNKGKSGNAKSVVVTFTKKDPPNKSPKANHLLYWDASTISGTRNWGIWRVIWVCQGGVNSPSGDPCSKEGQMGMRRVTNEDFPLADTPCPIAIDPTKNQDDQLYNVKCVFKIVGRGPQKIAGSDKKDIQAGGRVKSATQLSNAIGNQSGGVGGAAKDGCTQLLKANISNTDGDQPPPDPDGLPFKPFAITLKNDRACFPPTGIITVETSHNLLASLSGVETEWMRYDLASPCGTDPGNPPTPHVLGPDELCIQERALQNDNKEFKHPADTCHKPNVPAGTKCRNTEVHLHFQIEVKDNLFNGINTPGIGAFPAGTMMIYDLNASNEVINVERLSYTNDIKNAAVVKPVPVTKTQFHITARGGGSATLKKTDIQAHTTNSIVTAPDTYIICRARMENPLEPSGPPPYDDPGKNSVGIFPVCYTGGQPNGWPKVGPFSDPPQTKELVVPYIGQPLILLNALGSPFLSTGPVNFPTYPNLDEVDPDGWKDQMLHLESPCMVNYTPGINLKVSLTVYDDNDASTDDTGSISVMLDSVPDPSPPAPAGTHLLCDDPVGVDDIAMTNYDANVNAKDPTADTDDDTDGDGCNDANELQGDRNKGGLRDPWNPWDFFDAEQVVSPRQITLPNDILKVAGSYGATTDPLVDRSKILGPFHWNKDGPDGTVNIPDDILGVAGQFGNRCDDKYPN